PMPANASEILPDIGGRGVTPAGFFEEISCNIPIQTARLLSDILELDRSAYIAAIYRLNGRARRGDSIFRLTRQGPAQCVEAEQRIRSRHDGRGGDGEPGNQIPADDVAKG